MKDEEKSSASEIECDPDPVSDNRREFLKKCGKFAVYTVPTISALLFFDKKNAFAGDSPF